MPRCGCAPCRRAGDFLPSRALCAWYPPPHQSMLCLAVPFPCSRRPRSPLLCACLLEPLQPQPAAFLAWNAPASRFFLAIPSDRRFSPLSSHSCFPLTYLINVAMLPRAGHGMWSRGHTGDGRGEEPAPSRTSCPGRARQVGTEQCQAVEVVHRHGDRGSNPGRVALSISEGRPSSRDVRDEAAAEDWE